MFSFSIVLWKCMAIISGYLKSLYDFHFDGTQNKWVPWSSLVTKYVHDPEMKFADILGKRFLKKWRPASIVFPCTYFARYKSFFFYFWNYLWCFFYYLFPVPTTDTTRCSWILEQMVKIKRPVLLVGDSGTSKTATILSFLKNLSVDTSVSWQTTVSLLIGSLHVTKLFFSSTFPPF